MYIEKTVVCAGCGYTTKEGNMITHSVTCYIIKLHRAVMPDQRVESVRPVGPAHRVEHVRSVQREPVRHQAQLVRLVPHIQQIERAPERMQEQHELCSVCGEISDLQRQLDCTHRIHPHCADQWLRQGNTECPSCIIRTKECTICHDQNNITSFFTQCGHAFHKICLDGWLSTARTCPNCRAEI